MYLEACLLDVQRLVSLVPLGIGHTALEDTTLAGYNIPKVTLYITCNVIDAIIYWLNITKIINLLFAISILL